MLESVFGLVVDFLSVKDTCRVWIALSCPSMEREVVTLLCNRLRILCKRDTTERKIYVKMMTTQRCFECGSPTHSKVYVSNGVRRYMCVSCCETRLVSRYDMREAVKGAEKEARRRVVNGFTKYPLKICFAKRAKHGGAFLYWREDFEREMNFTTQSTSSQ